MEDARHSEFASILNNWISTGDTRTRTRVQFYTSQALPEDLKKIYTEYRGSHNVTHTGNHIYIFSPKEKCGREPGGSGGGLSSSGRSHAVQRPKTQRSPKSPKKAEMDWLKQPTSAYPQTKLQETAAKVCSTTAATVIAIATATAIATGAAGATAVTARRKVE